MRIEQLQYSSAKGWTALDAGGRSAAPQLVLVFGDSTSLSNGTYLPPLRKRFPDAAIVSCSTGGAILGPRVVTGEVTATAVEFESGGATALSARLARAEDSERVAASLARELPTDGLRHVLVFAEGLKVNGSALASGFMSALPEGVLVSGGRPAVSSFRSPSAPPTMRKAWCARSSASTSRREASPSRVTLPRGGSPG